MKTINEHIKQQAFKQVYLIYGEERYLVNQYCERLKTAIIGDDTMNYTCYDGDKPDMGEVTATAGTLPFFAERRLILFKGSGYMKSSNEEMTKLLKDMPEYLYIIFVEEDVDKRCKTYKAAADKGYVCEMKYQGDTILMRWVSGLMQQEGKRIDKAALQLLLEKTGVSMDIIRGEVEKLISYCADRDEVTSSDVEAVCTTQLQNKIFDMITAIATRNQRQALELYKDLLLLKEAPMRILYLMAMQFNRMLQVKELSGRGVSSGAIAKELGIPAFLVGKLLAQARSFTERQLFEALEYFAGREQDVKTGVLGDELAVEMAIVKYSSK